MKRISLILIGTLFYIFTGCAPISVTTDYDRKVNFSKYDTYRWIKGKEIPDDALAKNPLLKKRVKDAVDRKLKEKGFILKNNGEVSFVTVIHSGVEKRMDVTDRGRYGWYDPWWGPYGGRVDVSYYNYGTLVIDIVDAKKKELIWRGLGKGVVRKIKNYDKQQKEINDAVTKILEQFPPVAL